MCALPKATALTTYSYRLEHSRQAALPGALGTSMLANNLIADTGGDLDLDFHAIMHRGEDVALEKNYVRYTAAVTAAGPGCERVIGETSFTTMAAPDRRTATGSLPLRRRGVRCRDADRGGFRPAGARRSGPAVGDA